jgi:hypothetical protein
VALARRSAGTPTDSSPCNASGAAISSCTSSASVRPLGSARRTISLRISSRENQWYLRCRKQSDFAYQPHGGGHAEAMLMWWEARFTSLPGSELGVSFSSSAEEAPALIACVVRAEKGTIACVT